MSSTPAQGPKAVDLGSNIRARRQEHGLSLRELARRVGVSASALSQIENDRVRPSVDTLYAVAQELGVTPDEIFFGPDGGTPPAGTGGQRAGDPVAGLIAHGVDAHLSEVLELVPRANQQVVTLKGGEICRQIGGHSLPGVDALLLTYEPGAASPGPDEWVRHAGHEFNYVISGEVVVHVQGKSHPLQAGDTLTFPSDWPHRVTNPTDIDAEVLCLYVRGT